MTRSSALVVLTLCVVCASPSNAREPYLPYWPMELDVPSAPLVRVVLSYGRVSGIRTDGRVLFGPIVGSPFQREAAFDLAATNNAWWWLEGDGQLSVSGRTSLPLWPKFEGHYTSVAAGWYFGCAVDTAGRLHCWGGLDDMPGTPPDGLYRHIDASPDFVCATRHPHHEAGTGVDCWGGTGGTSLVMSRDGDFLAASAHEGRVCALRSDDAVECWSADLGDEPVRPGPYRKVATATSCLGTQRIHYTCALRADWTLDCWGQGGGHAPVAPPAGTFVDVDVDQEAACAVSTKNRTTCWHYATMAPMSDFIVAGWQSGVFTSSLPYCQPRRWEEVHPPEPWKLRR